MLLCDLAVLLVGEVVVLVEVTGGTVIEPLEGVADCPLDVVVALVVVDEDDCVAVDEVGVLELGAVVEELADGTVTGPTVAARAGWACCPPLAATATAAPATPVPSTGSTRRTSCLDVSFGTSKRGTVATS